MVITLQFIANNLFSIKQTVNNHFWSVVLEKKIFKELAKNFTKITHNAMKNRSSSLIFKNLVGGHLRNIHTKCKANLHLF